MDAKGAAELISKRRTWVGPHLRRGLNIKGYWRGTYDVGDYQLASGMLDDATTTGGSTRKPKFSKPMRATTGIVVSEHLDRTRKVPVSDIKLSDVNKWVEDNIDLLSKDQHWAGAWIAKEEDDQGREFGPDLVWLDVVTIYPKEQRQKAIDAGITHNQREIWDLDNMEPIITFGTGAVEKAMSKRRRLVGVFAPDPQHILDNIRAAAMQEPVEKGLRIPKLKKIKAKAKAKLSMVDGDGDGKIMDGTKHEAPAPKPKLPRGNVSASRARRSRGGKDIPTVSSKPKKFSERLAEIKEQKPVRVKSADEALKRIADGEHVEMDPEIVGVFLEKLSAIGKEAFDKGEETPDYDLCRVHVKNTNIFCDDNLGIVRDKMPQLSGKKLKPGSYAAKKLAKMQADAKARGDKKIPDEVDLADEFVKLLESQGVTVKPGKVDASKLKATQSQLKGGQVGGMMAASTIKGGKLDLSKPIFVSSDNYILDGHHRWASLAALQFTEGELLEMNVRRIDIPIQELVGLTNEFTEKMGVLPKFSKSAPLCIGCGEVSKRKHGKAGRGPNPKSTPKEIVGSHGHRSHGKSILWPALYEHLREKGYPKAKAAAISNAGWKKKRMGIPTNTPMSARGVLKADVQKSLLDRYAPDGPDLGHTYGKLTPKQAAQRKKAAAASAAKRRGKRKSNKLAYMRGQAAAKKTTGNRRVDLVNRRNALRQHAKRRNPSAHAGEMAPANYANLAVAHERAQDAIERHKQFAKSDDFVVSKTEDDQQLVFGWAYTTHDENGQLVVDKSGDFIDDPAELENAAYDFVLHSRQGGQDHARAGDSPVVKSTMVESVVLTPEKIEAMGIPGGSVPTGWWVGFKVEDPVLWQSVKDGKYTSFSIHGTGVRKAVEA